MKKKTLSYDEFVAHVRSLLDASGITQTEMARRLGVSRVVLARALKRQERSTYPSMLIALARELGGEEWEQRRAFERVDDTGK